MSKTANDHLINLLIEAHLKEIIMEYVRDVKPNSEEKAEAQRMKSRYGY
jgi:hypothetical protein